MGVFCLLIIFTHSTLNANRKLGYHMPTVDVFKNSKSIATVTFQRQFMILENTEGELRWEVEDELRKPGGGIIRIWARCEFEGYRIVYVLPTWTFIIDGVVQDSRFYEDIVLDKRRIELEFEGYRFVFR